MADIEASNKPIKFMHVQYKEDGSPGLFYRKTPIPGALYFGLEWENDYLLKKHDKQRREGKDPANKFLSELESAFEKIKRSTQSDHSAHVYWHKEDGSLTYGYETVTQPMTFDAMNLFLDGLISKKITSNTSKGTAGIHIHVNNDYFSTRQKLLNVCYLVNHLHQFFRRISGRSAAQMHWCDFDKEYQYGKQSYGAASMRSSTIEFRLFNTTSSPSVIKEYIYLTKMICEFANTKDDSLFNTPKNSELLHNEWFDYVRSREHKISTIIKRVKKSELTKK